MTEDQYEELAVRITRLFIPLDVPDTLGSINFAMKTAEVMGVLEDALGTANENRNPGKHAGGSDKKREWIGDEGDEAP
jgi:hypothetical protein